MSATELVQVANLFDAGDSSITVDVYDDAIEQLSGLAEDGDGVAEAYFASI